MKTLFYGGGVVSGQGVRRLDVLAEDGKIRDAAEGLRVPDAERVDCTGKLLFPGFIDGHTHFDL